MDKDQFNEILIADEVERENRIHELIRGRRSLNINTELAKNLTLGDKMADKMARFAGSWAFIILFGTIVLIWGLINTQLILRNPFDPYPYVFLNLILACISSTQAPIIMMSQNRDAAKERLRAENEYLINLKTEIIIEDLHMKMDDIINEQKALKKTLEAFKMYMDEQTKEKQLRSDLHAEGNITEKHTDQEESGLYH